MNNVNKTLYIPLYGKAYVSRRGIILHDPKAEQIWQQVGFVKQHDMTPPHLIDQLQGMEKKIFAKLYAGKFARKLYKMYEYEKI